MRERRAYLITAGMSLLLSVICILFCINFVDDNNRKWCDIVNTIILVPVPKPADPSAHPSREKAYQYYVKFVKLDKSLGCSE